MKFRKKPVIIEAIQYDGDMYKVMDFTESSPDIGFPLGKDYCTTETLEGVMRCNIGDWIIRGINGEFYPCKPDIFEITYEKVEE